MKLWTKSLAGVGAAALLAVSTASPAQAQRYDRDRDDGIDAGDIALGVAIIGGAALAIGALTDNDNDRYRNHGYDTRYGYDSRYRNDSRYGYNAYGYGGEQAALNACAAAARRYGQLETITDVDRRNNGAYRVRGRVLMSNWNNRGWNRGYDVDRESFSCYAQGGRVYDFRV